MKAARRFTDVKTLEPERVLALAEDHLAVVEGRTLFPTRRLHPLDAKRLLIEGKNQRKIGSHTTKGPWKGMPIFTLTLEERATCPRDCEQWRTCYGNGMQFSRRHTAGMELENLLWLEVRDLIKQHGRIAVRLHILGDFYSVEYAEWWQHMMIKHPGLHVFGFTARDRKSEIGRVIHNLNLLHPDRFAIRWSGKAGRMGAGVLDYVPDGNTVAGAFVCPAQTGRSDCCATCGLCWSEAMKIHPVVFVLHGRTKRSKGNHHKAPEKKAQVRRVTSKKPGRTPQKQVEPKAPERKGTITLVASVRTRERFKANAKGKVQC